MRITSGLLLGLLLSACSADDPKPGAGGTGGAFASGGNASGGVPSGGSGGTAAAASGGSAGGSGAASGGASGFGGADAGADAAPISNCTELSAKECFSNFECASDQRCQNLGTELAPVPCCVTGLRGKGAVGDPCTGEGDCASAVCVEVGSAYRCSNTCTTPADCPDGMKSCVPINFSGSPDNWCLPGS